MSDKKAKEAVEPDVVINGTKLSEAEAMTLRVALNDFGFSLSSENHGLRRNLQQGYLKQLGQIQRLIHETD